MLIRQISTLIALASALCVPVTKGALKLEITLFDNQSFDGNVTGTIDAGASIGAINNAFLYIGVPGDTDWISSNGNISSFLNGGSQTVSIEGGIYTSSANGDSLGLDMDDNLILGDTVDLFFSFDTGGAFNPGNVDSNLFIISAGYDNASPFPDAASQVGAIPEPSTYALLMGGGIFGVLIWSRRSR